MTPGAKKKVNQGQKGGEICWRDLRAFRVNQVKILHVLRQEACGMSFKGYFFGQKLPKS